jgi:hypothetical protein
VLFEDLRLEVTSIYDDRFGREGRTNLFRDEVRQSYFLRRALATLREFSDGIVGLDGEEDFHVLKSGFSAKHQESWTESVNYFRRVKHTLRKIRNDVGGHFTVGAAKVALERIQRAEHGSEYLFPSIGFIEYENVKTRIAETAKGRISHPLKLHFTSHIAIAATVAHSEADNPWDKANELLKEFSRAHKHATSIVVILVSEYLWKRFRA